MSFAIQGRAGHPYYAFAWMYLMLLCRSVLLFVGVFSLAFLCAAVLSRVFCVLLLLSRVFAWWCCVSGHQPQHQKEDTNLADHLPQQQKDAASMQVGIHPNTVTNKYNETLQLEHETTIWLYS